MEPSAKGVDATAPSHADGAHHHDSNTPQGCFHCGLPLLAGTPAPHLDVLGESRAFCCHGCEAVCKAIVDAGLDDYYRHRESDSAADRQAVPEILQHLELYDRDDIQKDFVRSSDSDDWREASLLLEDIRCPACLWLNERHLRSLPGVIDVSLDDLTHRARVRWRPQQIQLSEILRAIADIGYIAHPYDSDRSDSLQQLREQRSVERLIFAGIGGMMTMNFSLATYLMPIELVNGQLPLWVSIGRWTSLLVSLLLLAYPGQEFFVSAWRDLKRAKIGMDLPIVLGLSAAFLGSLHATAFGHGEVYFDSIAMFVFLLLLARRWELKGKIQASNQLERISHSTPSTATRLDSNGEQQRVAAIDLQIGDRIQLLPGEALAVDGVLREGSSSFDEALLTGEATPVLRQVGDHVIAGSVNGDQPVVVEVRHAAQASAVSEIRRLVDQGLQQRPGYALLAERVASVFVVALLLLASATALFWLSADPGQWLPNTIAVLIVTCPCALALATPVSLAVSAGGFMRLGVLPLRMDALDSLALANMVVFDKTGTLTQGRPALALVEPQQGMARQAILDHAAALSSISEHPIARSLRQQPGVVPGGTELRLTQADNVPGGGIRARLNDQPWVLGSEQFVSDGGVQLDQPLQQRLQQLRAQGHSVSLLANSHGIQALLAFADPLRAGAKEMIDTLRRQGVQRFAILSGDSPASVQRLARQLDIDEALGDMSPSLKLEWINARQAEGQRLAMFGDGINDAPVLAAADVSLSCSDATDLANASSDFLLLGNDLRDLAAARQLARDTRRNIIQNLSWAAAYNLLAIPLAMAGWIPPWGAAIGMSASSLLVVMNALRLQRTVKTPASDAPAATLTEPAHQPL